MSNKNSANTKVNTNIITFWFVLSESLLLTFDSSGISAPSSGLFFFFFLALCFSNLSDTACACFYNLTNLKSLTNLMILTILAAPAAALAPDAPDRLLIDWSVMLRCINSLTGIVGLINTHNQPISGTTLITAAKSNQK